MQSLNTPSQHTLLSKYRLNAPSQCTLSVYPLNKPSQHTLLASSQHNCTISVHLFNTLYQYPLSNLLYQSTHPHHTPYQYTFYPPSPHTLSTHPVPVPVTVLVPIPVRSNCLDLWCRANRLSLNPLSYHTFYIPSPHTLSTRIFLSTYLLPTSNPLSQHTNLYSPVPVTVTVTGRTALTFGAEQTAYLAKEAMVRPTDDASKYTWDSELSTTVKVSHGYELTVVSCERLLATLLCFCMIFPVITLISTPYYHSSPVTSSSSSS